MIAIGSAVLFNENDVMIVDFNVILGKKKFEILQFRLESNQN